MFRLGRGRISSLYFHQIQKNQQIGGVDLCAQVERMEHFLRLA